MTSRKCKKCGDDLYVNHDLGLMECVSGRHIEPIKLNRPQYWNKCPKCGQKGVNGAQEEPLTQVVKKVDNGKGGKVRVPVVQQINDKEFQLVFNEKTPKPITCRACGSTFIKKAR